MHVLFWGWEIVLPLDNFSPEKYLFSVKKSAFLCEIQILLQFSLYFCESGIFFYALHLAYILCDQTGDSFLLRGLSMKVHWLAGSNKNHSLINALKQCEITWFSAGWNYSGLEEIMLS